MSENQRKDYFDEIIAYDERVQRYCAKTHAKLIHEHLANRDLSGEMAHLGYIWEETKVRFNKLMQEKILEMGYNPRFTAMGSKYYKLDPSYLHKSKEKIEAAKRRYMKSTESYTHKNKFLMNWMKRTTMKNIPDGLTVKPDVTNVLQLPI